MSDQNGILPQGPGSEGQERLSEDKLMAYLSGSLSPAGQHEVELWLANEGMESDAVEGLRTIPQAEVKHAVSQLNHNLRKAILRKKRRRKPLDTGQITWIAIVIVLLLAVLAFVVIRKAL